MDGAFGTLGRSAAYPSCILVDCPAYMYLANFVGIKQPARSSGGNVEYPLEDKQIQGFNKYRLGLLQGQLIAHSFAFD